MKLFNITLLLVALMSFNSLSAQEKKTYYFNEKSDLLNETNFNELTKDKERFGVLYETDTAFIAVSYKTIMRGQLDKEAFESLKSALKSTSKKEFSPDGFIVID